MISSLHGLIRPIEISNGLQLTIHVLIKLTSTLEGDLIIKITKVKPGRGCRRGGVLIISQLVKGFQLVKLFGRVSQIFINLVCKEKLNLTFYKIVIVNK